MRLIPVFVVAGAAFAMWVAVQLVGNDIGTSAMHSVALLAWMLLPLAFGLFGGFMTGMLSCKAAVGIGLEVFWLTSNWPAGLRIVLVLFAQVVTLSAVGVIAGAWVIFSGSGGPSHYRGT